MVIIVICPLYELTAVRVCAVKLAYFLLPRKGNFVQLPQLRKKRGLAFLEAISRLTEATPLTEVNLCLLNFLTPKLPEFLELSFVHDVSSKFGLLRPVSGSVVASELRFLISTFLSSLKEQ